MLLNSSTDSIEFTTSAALDTDWFVKFSSLSTNRREILSSEDNQGLVSTATTTTIVQGPQSNNSYQKQIELIIITNKSAVSSQTIRIKKNVNGTRYVLGPPFILQGDECLVYSGGAYSIYDENGLTGSGGGGGTTDHTLLSNLDWISSGHTGTGDTVAGFDGAGVPNYLTIGTDIQAYDGDLDAISALVGTGIARRTGASTWTVGTAVNLTTEVSGSLPVANGGTGGTTQTTARTGIAAAPASAEFLCLSGSAELTNEKTLAAGTLLDGTTVGSVHTLDVAFLGTKVAAGRNTAGSGVAEEVTIHQMLDWIGTATRGAIIVRGVSDWYYVPAGAAGEVLTSNGAGADPTYQATGGMTYPIVLGITYLTGT